MRFTLPQFINHEAKIVGPLTFKQTYFVGTASLIVLGLYFTIAETRFFLFILISAALLVGSFALALVRVNGKTIPGVLVDFLNFSINPKIYLWKRKEIVIKAMKRTRKKTEPEEEKTLKFAEKSRLKKLSVMVETSNK